MTIRRNTSRRNENYKVMVARFKKNAFLREVRVVPDMSRIGFQGWLPEA
jgi:hypothetical protein